MAKERDCRHEATVPRSLVRAAISWVSPSLAALAPASCTGLARVH